MIFNIIYLATLPGEQKNVGPVSIFKNLLLDSVAPDSEIHVHVVG